MIAGGAFDGKKISVSKRNKTINVKGLFKGLNSLTSRVNGLELRKLIEQELKKNDTVTIDFDGIELITQSFGDEVIGVIVREKGIDFVKNKIKVKNANDFIRGTLNWVVSYSKKMV